MFPGGAEWKDIFVEPMPLMQPHQRQHALRLPGRFNAGGLRAPQIRHSQVAAEAI